MTTEKRAAANRRNALKSTGPRTPEGKKRASLNALKHGLRASSLAVPVLENPEDWRVHLDLVVRDLAPVGYVETVFSERIAALLWRLGRVVRYETEAVSAAIARETEEDRYADKETPASLKERLGWAERDEAILRRVHGLKGTARVSGEDASLVLHAVADALDVDLYPEDGKPVSLDIPGVPNGPEDDWEDYNGWTRDLVEVGVQALKARVPDLNPNVDPWDLALDLARQEVTEARKRYKQRAAAVDRGIREALLPSEGILDKVSRYETHLERSLFRTLHELQRLRAGRSMVALPPPAALDVDVAVHQEAS